MMDGRGIHRGSNLSPGPRFSAARVLLPIAGACLAFMLSANDARAEGTAGTCADPSFAALTSPIAPWKGAPLRIIFTTDMPIQGELSLTAPDGRVAVQSRER